MKVKELIEKLQAFDPELTVTYSDSEYGDYTPSDIDVYEDAWVSWDKATVLRLGGDEVREADIDPKYFKKQERPKHSPTPFMDSLLDVYRSQLQSQLSNPLIFNRMNHPSTHGKMDKDGVVTFNIIKGDKE